MSSTDGGFRPSPFGWDIQEHDSYDESVLQCGGHVEIDEALMWLDLFLNRNPLAFPLIHPASEIRIAKTKMRIKDKGAKVFPAYRLLFTTNEVTKVVTKLHVRACQPEEMPFSDPWDDDEEPPF
ncbi:MAG: hypothetical protein QOG13_444 [Sphingomonadales bacterium]|nr:hypothetical protein [Sphingomonadales bacterium]MEA3044826.1 hypothetical protein [Sphingomonadales bacterium]